MSETNPKALKHMYGPAFMQRMADALSYWPDFDKKTFLALLPELEKLEMKPRVCLIRDELHCQLPKDFPQALRILLKATKPGQLKGFDLWPFTEYIQAHGLGDVDLSLKALKVLTVPFTSEFAVRPFIRQHTEETLIYLLSCAGDRKTEVRRWASEGSRPRLPWGEKLHLLIENPELTLPILEKLKFDPELFVRKSVANHLNDITKDHPSLVLKTLRGWQKQATGDDIERVQWITRYALRTLIKKGDADALKLIGVRAGTNIKLSGFALGKTQHAVNEDLKFEFVVQSHEKKTQKVVIDYRITFDKAKGKPFSKVFKLKTVELVPGEKCEILKKHRLREVTTRKLFTGKYQLEILVNGESLKKVFWHLR